MPVKVGGMRIAPSNRPNNNTEKAPAPAAETGDAVEEDDETAAPTKSKDPALYISGAVSKGDKDFPTEAVRAFHDKPKTQNAAYGLRDNSAPKNVGLFQPRKQ